MKPLAVTLEAAARVVNNVIALPWLATVTKTAMNPEGKSAPCLTTPPYELAHEHTACGWKRGVSLIGRVQAG